MTVREKKSSFKYVDPLRKESRMKLTSSVYKRYKSYLDLYFTALKESKRDPKQAAKLSNYVAERLFEAECHLRIFLKEAIIALNELKDSGGIEATLRNAIKEFSSDDGFASFNKKTISEADKIKSHYPNLELGFLNEGVDLWKKYIKNITSKEGQLHISARYGDKEVLLVLEPKPRPGDTGRVGWQRFFDPNITVDSTTPMILAESCHNEEITAKVVAKKPIDIYGSMIAGLAYTRDYVYFLARRTGEVGLGAFEGKAPVGALIVSLAVYGTILYVAGNEEDIELYKIIGIVGLVLAGALFVGYLINPLKVGLFINGS